MTGDIIDKRNLEPYLSTVFGGEAVVMDLKELGKGVHGAAYLIEVEVKGEVKKVVLKQLGGEGFSHDYPSDRAGVLFFAHHNFNKLENHVGSLDVGGITSLGNLISLGRARDFFLLTEKAEGTPYAEDLDRIKKEGKLIEKDRERARILGETLAEINSEKKDNPNLYLRHIRDLVGHGEMTMGVIDTYPKDVDWVTQEEFIELEKRLVEWRGKIKWNIHRLRRIHGDPHVFNIWFHENNSLTLLDRSREEYGEPADDVTCLTINYIFWSLQASKEFSNPFKELYDIFFEAYLEKTKDQEIFKFVQPFYAFRALVVAHPLFYPDIETEVRRKLFNFAMNILETEEFKPENINEYLYEKRKLEEEIEEEEPEEETAEEEEIEEEEEPEEEKIEEEEIEEETAVEEEIEEETAVEEEIEEEEPEEEK